MKSARLALPRVTSFPRTMIRPLVKSTSRRICVVSSQPARVTAGVMNLLEISVSLSDFLSIWPHRFLTGSIVTDGQGNCHEFPRGARVPDDNAALDRSVKTSLLVRAKVRAAVLLR